MDTLGKEIWLIAAMSRDRLIGVDGMLPWSIRSDLRFFQDTTAGHDVIVGQDTFASINVMTNGSLLPGRHLIVISRRLNPVEHDWVTIVKSPQDALAAARLESNIFIAGGAQIYTEFLPYATHIILTVVDMFVSVKDRKATYFPEFEERQWIKSIARVEGLPGEPRMEHHFFERKKWIGTAVAA